MWSRLFPVIHQSENVFINRIPIEYMCDIVVQEQPAHHHQKSFSMLTGRYL